MLLIYYHGPDFIKLDQGPSRLKRSWGCCNTKTVQKVAATFWPGQNVVIAVQNVAAIFWRGQNVAVTF